MPADANVFQALVQAPKSVMDYHNDLDQRDFVRQRNALQNLALQQQNDQVQQGMVERNALRRVASAWTPQTTVAERVAALRGTGMPGLMQQADTLETQDLARRKTDAEINDKTADTAGKNQAQAIKARQDAYAEAAALNTPEDAIAALNRAVSAGKVPMAVVPAFQRMVTTDPLWKLKLLQGALDPEKLKDALLPHFQAAGGAMVNTNPLAGPMGQGQPNAIPITQSADNAATNATSRANNAATIAASQQVYDPERGIVVNKGTGAAKTAVTPDGKPVGGKDKPLTDSQAKAYAFGTRMQAANKIIDELAEAGTLANMPGTGSGYGIGRTITAFSSPNQQRLEQAKRDWINANLRRESGAVIGESEFESADRQYFAQPGDSKAVIAQKAANRKLAEQGVLAEVPAGRLPGGAGAAATPPGTPLKPGTVLKFDANGNPVQS